MKSRSRVNKLLYIIEICIVSFIANCTYIILNASKWYLVPLFVVVFLVANFLPLILRSNIQNFRLKICSHGVMCLKIFLWSSLISLIFQLSKIYVMLPEKWLEFVIAVVVCICVEAVVFWNGIISVYCTSIQLGLKKRIVGIICGYIPILNIILLNDIIKTVYDEINFELEKIELDISRKEEKICNTKYPILLVHGVFFRDYKYRNYWGRIPKELEKNGAKIFYGQQQSAASVYDSGKELALRIREIIEETGCEKINIIAHSKGGLDARMAISCCDVSQYVASLTTINTPHKGCEFAEYILTKIPENVLNNLANVYNGALKKLGDKTPDFLAAVNDLTASACLKNNEKAVDVPGVFYQSVGSKLNKAINGKFPLNFTYALVKYFDGSNDGLVAETSFKWGEKYNFITTNNSRGISHGDVIDLNLENINGFDVREFYVQLVHELKEKGF